MSEEETLSANYGEVNIRFLQQHYICYYIYFISAEPAVISFALSLK